MNNTKIEWTDMSWNPVTGCKHGCDYCYARRIYQRFGRSFEPAFHPDRLDQPLRKKKPCMVFVCSVADLFGSWVPKRWIDAVIRVVRKCPQHTFQFLTKDGRRLASVDWPDNAWVGMSATNQRQWDNAVKHLKALDAQVRFISAEPMIGEIRSNGWMPDWLIIGAQTGPGGKQPKTSWVGNLTSAARRRRCAVFYKPNLVWDNPPREFPARQPFSQSSLPIFR